MTFSFPTEPAWVRDATIFVVRHGSHAYGLAREGSDVDHKGVAVPPLALLYDYRNDFEQVETHEPDVVIYDVRKFLRLASECNPNIIELLWAHPEDRVVWTPSADLLVAHRKLFLSRKARQTFAGYALAQLKRIRTHRRWLTQPPAAAPTRAAFGLPERTVIPADQLAAAHAQVTKQLDIWQADDLEDVSPAGRIALANRLAEMFAATELTEDRRYAAAARWLGMDDNFMALLDRERHYSAAQNDWRQFTRWQLERNPKRAALEAQHGYDTKHAMHLVRLLRMCREILTTAEVVVRRPDRDELLAVRDGAWSYDQLIEWADAANRELDVLGATSPLPRAPDTERIASLGTTLFEAMSK